MVEPLPRWREVQAPDQLHGLACVMCGEPFTSTRAWRRRRPRVVAASRLGTDLLACATSGCAALALVLAGRPPQPGDSALEGTRREPWDAD